jgi:tRNA-specific 2-thiouridylase
MRGDKQKIAVAMSGGVDSSVAAALLVEAGHEVLGFTMDLFALPSDYCRDADHMSCCGREAAHQAQRVARSLGIEHFMVDMKSVFEKTVIEDFCGEYALGRTPNPCIRCNEYIKFAAFLRLAKQQGVDRIATGHHARILRDEQSGRFYLKKGRDPDKDQSYFLYGLSQAQLAASLFPVGEMTKPEVRDLARRKDLPVAYRPESQEICFIPDNNYGRFLAERIPELARPGPIVDRQGNVLGQHPGIIHFTIGQRRGLGLSAPLPLYVLEIKARDNIVVVGSNQELYKSALLAGRLNWIARPGLERPLKVRARIRYQHREAPATIVPLPGEKISVEFDRPQRAITPGQSVVFYDDDTVLGGGIIEAPLD